MSASPLGVDEREEIYAQLQADPAVTWAKIARVICRHPSTVAREVDRNGGRVAYRPSIAQDRADTQRCRPKPRMLAQSAHRDRVRSELAEGRSPYAIWAGLVAEGAAAVPCTETIYTSVYAGTLDIAARDCLRTRRPRRRPRQRHSRPLNRDLPTISTRPTVICERAEPGHWEADLIKSNR